MLKKAMTYTNFNGDKVTEDFYFHIDKAELIRLQFKGGGLEQHLAKLINAKDGEAIVDEITSVVLMSVGKKSADGNRFIHNDEIVNDFKGCPAFGDLVMELALNAELAASFAAAVVPAGLREDLEKLVAAENAKVGGVTGGTPTGGASITNEVVEAQRAAHPEADPHATEPKGIFADVHPTEPIILTRDQVLEMDNDELKAGLASGRFIIGA